MKQAMLIGAVVLTVFAGRAAADLTIIGDPVEGGSWSQAFNESGVGPFTGVSVQMSAGDTFESLTHYGLPAGWSVVYESPGGGFPTLATASGPARTSMDWNIRFAGANSNPLVFDFAAFDAAGNVVNSAHAVWGPGWGITKSP